MDFGTGRTSSSFPSTTVGYRYGVFLSFRGEDTRNNFVSHLYTALDNKGIHTFKDDEKLQQGTIIKPELFKAIEESRFAIVILSINYASSSWCLIELAKIIECMEKTGITVLPVFHGVDPSDVRNLRGVFEEAFVEHSDLFGDKIDEVNNWRDALVKVANIAGWDLRHRSESPVIEEIVSKINGQWNSIYSNVHEDCVGLDSRVTKIKNSYLGIGLEDVRFIGIWGMGGMGKTTLARVLCQRIHYHFDANSFIGDVRKESCKNGLSSLQKLLLDDILIESNIRIRDIQWGIKMIKDRLRKKKVLIILDDVDQLEQLKALAGKRDWFGPGSRIIITTRDRRLLIAHDMTKAEIYEVKKLEENEALKLFSREVFKKDYPSKDFLKMSQNVIHYADGLPLALNVLGESLVNTEPVVWKNILAKLKEDPPSKLKDVLASSFNGLHSKEKNLFLDIACFFKGLNKDWVANILQVGIEIDILVEKSLIKISHFGKLWIHDRLQDFGREIVHHESLNDLGQCSRLWLSNDIFHVLKHNKGTEKVEGIILSSSFLKEKEHLNAEVFSKMTKLRVLQINHVHLPLGLDYLSNELCFMNWEKYPLESLPESFHPNKLIELIMRASSLKQLWKGIKISKMLKHIDLSDSKDLIMTPDVTEAPNLEKLILKGCTSLSTIHTSLEDHKKLILLNLDGCLCLESLPNKISLESLEIFSLKGCLRLKKFPKIGQNMSRLLDLLLNGTAIEGLPSTIKHLTGLTQLNLRNCKSLLSLPYYICHLTSLTSLTLSGCSRLDRLPKNLGNLTGLSVLDVSETAIRELPSLEHLSNLTSLILRDCKDLLRIRNAICNLTNIERLTLSAVRLKLPSLNHLRSLVELELRDCNLRAVPEGIDSLRLLESLNLSENNFVCFPGSIIRLSKLKDVYIENCTGLRSLTRFPSSTHSIWANGCTSLEDLPDKLKRGNWFEPNVYLLNCFKLVKDPRSSGIHPFSKMLSRYFQELCYYDYSGTKRYDLVFPGRKLPKWFSHQSAGASVTLQAPPNFDEKCLAIGMCAVFEHLPSGLGGLFDSGSHDTTRHMLFCSIALRPKSGSDGFMVYSDSKCISFPFSENFGPVESRHLWLIYVRREFFDKIKDQVFSNGLHKFEENGFDFQIEFQTKGTGLTVTNCGAHFVFKQDIEDLSKTNEMDFVFYDNHLNSEVSADGTSRVEPSHDGNYDGAGPSGEGSSNELRGESSNDGAGPSGEGSSNGMTGTKRIRRPNRMLRLGNWFGNLWR